MSRFFEELFRAYDEEEKAVHDIMPYRDDRQVLVEQNRQLQLSVKNLTDQVQKNAIDDSAVAQTRVALHASSSLFAYTLFSAVFLDGPLLNHPHLATVILTGNLLLWTMISAFRKFGT